MRNSSDSNSKVFWTVIGGVIVALIGAVGAYYSGGAAKEREISATMTAETRIISLTPGPTLTPPIVTVEVTRDSTASPAYTLHPTYTPVPMVTTVNAPLSISEKQGFLTVQLTEAKFSENNSGILIELKIRNDSELERKMSICSWNPGLMCKIVTDTGQVIDSSYHANAIDNSKHFQVIFNSETRSGYWDGAQMPTDVNLLVQIYIPGLTTDSTHSLQLLQFRLFDREDNNREYKFEFRNIPLS